MPTEKNAAFLPTQYSFNLDRQRVKTVNKPRNVIIALQVNYECRLLIKTIVCIEHSNVKGILIHDY